MSRIERKRETAETSIGLSFDPYGSGEFHIQTPLPFLSHILGSFARFGRFDMDLKAEGDIEVDAHHTVEDVGIVLGEVVREACNAGGMNRIGYALVPMDDALVAVALDLCGRVFWNITPELKGVVGGFDAPLLKEFFSAFSARAGCVIHIRILAGENTHHICEALFKAFGVALAQALAKDERLKGRPLSTKEKL